MFDNWKKMNKWKLYQKHETEAMITGMSPLNAYNYIYNYILAMKKSSYKILSSLIVKFSVWA